MISIACGLPCCAKPHQRQTNWSVALRATAVVLGVLAIVVGALILNQIDLFSRLGPGAGWGDATVNRLEIQNCRVFSLCTESAPMQGKCDTNASIKISPYGSCKFYVQRALGEAKSPQRKDLILSCRQEVQ